MPHEPSHAAVQDSRCSHVRSGISLAQMTGGGEVHYDDARRVLGSLSSPNAVVHAFIAATHAQLGSSADAERAASLFVSTARPLIDAAGTPMPESWVRFVTVRYPSKRDEDAEHLAAGPRKTRLS